MKKIKWTLLLIGILLLSAGCASSERTGRPVSSFSFTDQHGQSFGTDQLAGQVWIADFIFTQCDTVCPPMTYEMASLQQTFEEEGIDANFVSFTVDPATDTPDVLKDYAAAYTDDDTNWHLLTGYSQKAIESLALTDFQTIVQKPETSTQVIHGTNFYVVDQEGYIVGEFNFTDSSYVQDMTKLIRSISK